MANIKLAILPILVTNHVIIEVERVDDLGTEITRQVIDPPPSQHNLTFPDLDPVMYRFFFWESADGLSLDTLLGSADIDGSLAFDFLLEIFEIQVNGPGPQDPVDTQNQYRNPALAGCDILQPGVTPTGPVYTVSHRAEGQKLVSEITNVDPPGGFDLNNGDLFYDGDIWFVTKYSRVIAQVPATAGTWPSDVVTITDQVTALDDTHLNKELEFDGVFDVMTAQLPDLGTVADKKYLIFNTHRLTGNYLFLDFSLGGSLWFQGAQLSSFWMTAGEELSIVLKGHVARVVHYTGNARIRGRIVPDMMARAGKGYLLADGTQYTKAQVPGLYDAVLNMPAGDAVSYADWNSVVVVAGENTSPFKSCYGLDAGAETIKVPDMRNLAVRFLKLAVDAERMVSKPGGYQHDNVRTHLHTGTYKQGKSDDNESGVSGSYLRVLGAAGGTNYGNVTADVGATGGSESRGKNSGQIPLVTL